MSLIKKRLLGLLALAGLCALVGGLLLWQDKFEASQAQSKESAQKLFTSKDRAAIKEITLATPQGTFVLQRSGTGDTAWRLTQPMQTLAEASIVDGMLQAALDLRTTARVGGKGPKDDPTQAVPPVSDLGLFGLQPPRYSLTLKQEDGHTETLLVGKKNGYDGSLYVKAATRDEVGMVSSNFAYQLDQDTFKLREKRPVIFSADDVIRLTVSHAQGPGYTLERRDHGFVLTAPLQADADAGNVDQLLGALSSLRAKAFAAESASTPVALKPFGLDKPTHTAQLSLKDNRQVTLNFGQITLGAETHYFVTEPGEHPVLELGSDWAFKKLGISAQDLRDLHVLAFDRDAVRGMTLTRGKDSLTFSKVHDDKRGEDVWRVTAPSNAEVQTHKVVGLLYKLWNLKADNVAKESPSEADLKERGLASAETRIDLQGANDASLGSILFGHVDGDKVFVTSNKHLRIDRVAKALVDDISLQLGDYQENATAKSN